MTGVIPRRPQVCDRGGPHRLAALVFEDDPAAEAAVLLSAARSPSTPRPRRRRARSPAALRSGRSSRPVAAGTRSPRWCTAPGTCRRPGRGPGQRPPLVLPPGGQRPGLQRRQLPPSSRHCAACPREASADAPPAHQACRHCRTDRSLTRSSTAITADGTRCSNLLAASSRTCSRRLWPSAVRPPPCAYLMQPAYRRKQSTSAPADITN
jgi:hypothetical protein